MTMTKEEKSAYMKKYNAEHKGNRLASAKKYRDANKESIREKENARRKINRLNNPAREKLYQQQNREKRLRQTKEYCSIHAGELRLKYIQKTYGLSPESYCKMLSDNNNKCAICDQIMDNKTKICVDHCHNTNTVRGLLCRNCNIALGHFKDNTEVMQRAIDYINKHTT